MGGWGRKRKHEWHSSLLPKGWQCPLCPQPPKGLTSGSAVASATQQPGLRPAGPVLETPGKQQVGAGAGQRRAAGCPPLPTPPPFAQFHSGLHFHMPTPTPPPGLISRRRGLLTQSRTCHTGLGAPGQRGGNPGAPPLPALPLAPSALARERQVSPAEVGRGEGRARRNKNPPRLLA